MMRFIKHYRSFLKKLSFTSQYLVQYRFYTNRNIMKLSERGLFEEIFPPSCPYFLRLTTTEPISVYAGFDPTADSLHIGNLLVIMALLHCQRAGHKVIALIGGATAQIGDPSGRSTERELLDVATIKRNSRSIASSLKRIFDNHQKHYWENNDKEPLHPLIITNNANWYSDISAVEFVAKIGRNFRIGRMMAKKSIEDRLNVPGGDLSFTEFTYQMFQSYDWLQLYRKYKCVIQIGGSDQMGNIVAGHELISKIENKQVYGCLVPLMTTAEGNKFSKTGKAVWLNGDKTTPFSLYQFFCNLQHVNIEKYLKLFTFLPLSNIKHLIEKHKRNPDSRHAQKTLAESVTRLVHGEEGVKSAKKISEVLSSKTPEDLATLSEEEFNIVFSEAQRLELLLHPGITVLKMAMLAHCFPTETTALNTIKTGRFFVNQRCVTSPESVILPGEHILPSNMTLIRIGKKNYYAIKWLM